MPNDSQSFEKPEGTSNSLICRESRPSDAVSIQRILRDAKLSYRKLREAHGVPTDEVASGGSLVCERGGNLLGVLQWRQVGEELEIFDVAVDGTHHRQGIAGLLLESLLSLAKKRGVKEIFLEVRESNVAALALYRKFGFTVGGRRPYYYRDPDEPALLLHLNVTG
jgi:ribosomal-protein-alanine acetyltransferase